MERMNSKFNNRMKSISIAIILCISILTSCTKRQPQVNEPIAKITQEVSKGQLIADTIIYDVIIHNLNPDDLWAEQTLQYLNHQALIDSLFELVYQKRAVAYDYFEMKPLKIKDIIRMENEEGYSRDHIGKIQFTERWYFDATALHFNKEVLAIVLGYDLINSDSTLRGHKPVFKIYLNKK